MKDRLLKFLSENNLTATRFADEIGVQRSSISHILSGRNKPSFDFIHKTLEKYSELNAEWLITGKGEMYQNNQQVTPGKYQEPDLFSSSSSVQPAQQNIENKQQEKKQPEKVENNHYPSEKMESKPIIITEHSIKKVIIFYADGSFEEYKPSGKE